MATTTTTTLMSLVLPIPGPAGELGPTWATDLNTAFGLVDTHDHSSGKGSRITPSGLNINQDLDISTYNLKQVGSSRYVNQGSPLAGTLDKSCVYVSGGNLYYNNSSGTAIQLTSGGAINVASVGTITGDYSSTSATVSYSNTTKTYSFLQGTPNTTYPAKMVCGDISLTDLTSLNAVTLKAFPSLASGYTFNFPSALPGATSLLGWNTSGQASSFTGDGVTAQITGAQFAVIAGGLVDGVTTTAVSNQIVVRSDQLFHLFGAYGPYTVGTFIDGIMMFEYNATIIDVVINGTVGTSGTTEFDILYASTSGGAFASIFSTTPKIASTAASNVWTDTGALVGAQTGVTKGVLSTTTVAAGGALRFDLKTVMGGLDGSSQATITVYWKKR
jgi:hypothetical protein